MTKWYASKAEANGIPAGSSGGQGTISDPFDTIEACWKHAGFVHGEDSVLCNGTKDNPQTYSEDSNGLNFAANDTSTIVSVTGDMDSVIIEQIGAGLGVIQLGNTPDFQMIGVTLRATGTQPAVLRAYNAAQSMDTILYRCKLDGNGVAQKHIDHDGNFRLIECELIGEVRDQCIFNDVNFAGTTMLIKNKFNFTFSAIGTLTTAFDFSPQVDGCHLFTSDNTGTITTLRTTSTNTLAIISGYESITNIKDSFTTLGDIDYRGWNIIDHSTRACIKVRSFDCSYVNSASGEPNGSIGWRVGIDGPGAGGGISDVIAGNLTVSNYNHGKMFGGGVSNAIGWGGNADKCVIAYLNKLNDSTVKWVSGSFTDPIMTGGSPLLYNKASDGTISNISGIVPDGFNRNIQLAGDDGGTVHCVNAVFKNNDIKFAGTYTGYIMIVLPSSTVDVGHNNYAYSDEMELTSNYFFDQATQYNYGEWLVHKEPTSFLNLTNLKFAGEYITDSIDDNGQPFNNPPSVGSTELLSVLGSIEAAYSAASSVSGTSIP